MANRFAAGRAAAFILAAAACAVLCGLVFLALLSLWGAAFAPWVRLQSASFVIVSALALSATVTALAWRAFYLKHLSRPRNVHRSR